MRTRVVTALLAMLVVAPALAGALPVSQASPAERYSQAYFGDGNLPPGCVRDMSVNNPDNICHHMRTDMNGLDSPQVDVLIMVPVSPAAERDMRIMRQSIEMWEAGIDQLARQMDLAWLADGMDFHITVDYIDPAGNGGEFTTYPVVDPEIVVIATNPVGGAGIGIDPLGDLEEIFGDPAMSEGPCHGIANPFDFEQWENLPGFNDHHQERTGTYVEDCDGAGGNICFAINGAVDPEPNSVEVFDLFDLVSHEVGHCLTVGHVGDGLEGEWGALPRYDIMAYADNPPGLSKCVSTLNVEGIATVMSRYLDVNGDGVVDDADRLEANDQIGDGRSPFQVQHPDDHLYASSTGSPFDCPQPDLGLVPGERTEWTPALATDAIFELTAPADGDTVADEAVLVTGNVARHSSTSGGGEPTARVDDADDDASTPVTEILSLDVEATDTHLSATIDLAELWPTTDVTSATSYSLTVNGAQFDSFVRYPIDSNPLTWDNSASAYVSGDDGGSSWDLDAKTVTFTLSREYLADGDNVTPYDVSASANVGFLSTTVVDDVAPDGDPLTVSGAPLTGGGGEEPPAHPVYDSSGTVVFTHPGGNTFYADQSTFGVTSLFGIDDSHTFVGELAHTSDVTVTLTWTGSDTGTDLDLYMTGAGVSGGEGATANPVETFSFTGIRGFFDLVVEPYFVNDAVEGSTYTLAMDIEISGDDDGDGVPDADDQCLGEPGPAPSGCPDADGDGVPDRSDVCPDVAGDGADGCPAAPVEYVEVYLNGALAGQQALDTANGPDSFAVPVTLPEGTHELEVVWLRRGNELAREIVSVTRIVDSDGDGVSDADDVCPGHDDSLDADGDGLPDGCERDRDADGVPDDSDNCVRHPNADQHDLDGDGQGDVCDRDMDGDGHANGKEEKHGTDPADPNSFPTRSRQ